MILRSTMILSLLAVCGGRPSLADDTATPEEAAFQEKVVPLLAKYCLDCHGETKPKAGVNLARYPDARSLGRDRKTWTRVLENVGDGLMPPEDEPQPTDEERTFLAQWIEARVSKADCDGTPYPGRVTIRRLNRAEYDNTIRDLVGIDFHPSADFPTDDVGYGFDNIGDVLTLSPLLLEKYLNAAEQVATRAILTDRTDRGTTRTWKGGDLRRAGGERHAGGTRILATTGEIGVTHEFPDRGEYTIRVRAFAHQAGDEPARIALRIDGQDAGTADVTATEDNPATYEFATTVPNGEHRVAVAFLNDYYDEASKADRNLLVQAIEVQGPFRSEPLPLPTTHTRIIFREPSDASPEAWRDFAGELLDRFASRAYRRPATPGDLRPIQDLVEDARREGLTFPEAMQLAIEAVLVSPNFLFRVELDGGASDNGPASLLGNYELASRLSYFLWSSMPDDELFEAARAGTLQQPEVLAAQARRMLRDEKASALVEGFAVQWLQLRGLEAVQPNRRAFPKFSEKLRQDMRTETVQFFAAVMAEDRSILEFLDSDYSYLNERLADFYGIAGVEGEEFRRVALSTDQRGGLLTQASVLAVTSNPTRTSPVKRGKWVLEQILGTPPPPPPPDVPLLSESREAIKAASLRERLEQHRADPNCAVCHNRLDPLGFVFENYDAIGGWREKDGDFPIDPSGELPSGESFAGPKPFKAYLLEKKDLFTRCLTEKLLTYALGRGLEPEDACEVDRIASAVAEDGHRFSRLVVEIVTSVPFRMREGQGTMP
jgi:hypothetical protein